MIATREKSRGIRWWTTLLWWDAPTPTHCSELSEPNPAILLCQFLQCPSTKASKGTSFFHSFIFSLIISKWDVCSTSKKNYLIRYVVLLMLLLFNDAEFNCVLLATSKELVGRRHMMHCCWMLGVPFCNWQSQLRTLMPLLDPNMVCFLLFRSISNRPLLAY